MDGQDGNPPHSCTAAIRRIAAQLSDQDATFELNELASRVESEIRVLRYFLQQRTSEVIAFSHVAQASLETALSFAVEAEDLQVAADLFEAQATQLREESQRRAG